MRATTPRPALISAGALAACLLLAGCGAPAAGARSATPRASTSSPAPTPSTITLPAPQAEALEATPGTEVTLAPETPAPTADPTPSADAQVTKATDALAGTINTDAKLPAGPADDYGSYVLRSSSLTTLSYEAPADLDQVADTKYVDGPSLSVFRTQLGFGNPVIIVQEERESAQETLDGRKSEYGPVCAGASEQHPYDDGRLRGASVTFSRCDGAPGATNVIAFSSVDPASPFTGFIETNLVDQRDSAALARAIRTLKWTP